MDAKAFIMHGKGGGTADHHGWLSRQAQKTRSGIVEFRNGSPTQAAAEALNDQLRFNRAIEVYLTQMPAVAVVERRNALRDAGATRYNQTVIWENLADAKAPLLTANSEAAYAMGFLDLRIDGPTVMDVPPKMLGAATDMLQRRLTDIGRLAPDKGQGGRYLFLPPGYKGAVPDGCFIVRSPTYTVGYFMRSFRVDGKTEQAIALMKQLKVYPLARIAHPFAMEFLTGSGRPIDTVKSDTFMFFEELAQIVEEEPSDVFAPQERFHMRAIGIEKGKAFAPDSKQKAVLSDAARMAVAMARADSVATDDPSTYFYDDRQWQALTDVPGAFLKYGVLEVDVRAFLCCMAISKPPPGLTDKHLGQGSQYLWTYHDADGDFLDGAKSYRLRVPPRAPVRNFWSVLVYDALSCAQLQNNQKFPSVSMCGEPKANADGSVDIWFGPTMAKGQENNWIETVPGKGWFPIFRFYGPLAPYFDQTWKLNDIEKAP